MIPTRHNYGWGYLTLVLGFIFFASVSAVEAQVAPTLAVTKSGTGAGVVSSVGANSGISCGSDCAQSYALDTVVTLRAIPDGTSAFVRWEGCMATPVASQCQLTISTQKQDVQAVFVKTSKVFVRLVGDGAGTIESVPTSSSPTAASCGEGCFVSPVGTRLVFEAIEKPGSIFLDWQGCPTPSTTERAKCIVDVGTTTRTVTARFAKVATLSVHEAIGSFGDGHSLTVTAPSDRVVCGGGVCPTLDNATGKVMPWSQTCSSGEGTESHCLDLAFLQGTVVTITPNPAPGIVGLAETVKSDFAYWLGGCRGNGRCAPTIKGAVTVAGVFYETPRVTIGLEGFGSGAVRLEDVSRKTPVIIPCNNSKPILCGYDFHRGTRLKITALPDANSRQFGWKSCPNASGNTCYISITGNKKFIEIAPVFEPTYTLSVSRKGNSGGSIRVITASGETTCRVFPCVSSFDTDAAVYIFATPPVGMRAYWSNGCTSVDVPGSPGSYCTVRMTQNYSPTVSFDPLPID